MSFFGLINYEDYILRTVLTSSYSRNTLTVLFIYIVTATIRFHLSVLICWICTWGTGEPGSYSSFFGPIFDFLFPILVGIFLSLTSDIMYQYIATHRPAYETMVDYFMNNYTRDNIIIWKRWFLVGLCSYVFLVTALITIDNWLIFISTVETVIAFIICDIIENREKIHKFFFDLSLRSKLGKLTIKSPIPNRPHIFNEHEFLNRTSTPIPSKPLTPPQMISDDTSIIPSECRSTTPSMIKKYE